MEETRKDFNVQGYILGVTWRYVPNIKTTNSIATFILVQRKDATIIHVPLQEFPSFSMSNGASTMFIFLSGK